MTAYEVIQKHNLTFISLLEDKTHVALAEYPDGTKAVVKSDSGEPYQFDILEAGQSQESSFYVPRVYERSPEDDYIIMEYVEGTFLSDMFVHSLEEALERAWNIVPDYNEFVREHISKDQSEITKEGRDWVAESLQTWSKPLIDRNILSSEDVSVLVNQLGELEDRYGNELFALTHRNIIFKHLLQTEGEQIAIFDVGAVPRPGKDGMYSYVRILDWMLLKTADPSFVLETYIKPKYQELISEYPQDMVDFVFALRLIGILGWDIYANKVSYVNQGRGASKEHKQVIEDYLKTFLP